MIYLILIKLLDKISLYKSSINEHVVLNDRAAPIQYRKILWFRINQPAEDSMNVSSCFTHSDA